MNFRPKKKWFSHVPPGMYDVPYCGTTINIYDTPLLPYHEKNEHVQTQERGC